MGDFRSVLNTLSHSGIKHVVFDGYSEDKMASPTKIKILCEDPYVIEHTCDLVPLNPPTVKKDRIYLIKDDPAKVWFCLYERGKGCFPDRFESELLEGRVLIDNHFYGPDSDRRFWATLYTETVHKGKFDPQIRRCFLSKIEERIGNPTKPKFSSLKFYNYQNGATNIDFTEQNTDYVPLETKDGGRNAEVSGDPMFTGVAPFSEPSNL